MTKIWFDDTLDLEGLTKGSSDCMPGYVGIEFTAYGDDWLQARMPVNERTKQPYGRLHGGASVVLAETIGSTGAAMTVDRSKFATVGMEINANHIKAVTAGFVTATCAPLKIGGKIHIWEIKITDEANELCCVSRFTCMIVPTRKP